MSPPRLLPSLCPGRWPSPLRSLCLGKRQNLSSLPPGALPPAASSACLAVSTWPLSVPPPVPIPDDQITCAVPRVSTGRSPCRSPSLFQRFSVLPRPESQARSVALNPPRSPEYVPPLHLGTPVFSGSTLSLGFSGASPSSISPLGLLQVQYPRLDHPYPLWQVTVKSLCDLNAPRLLRGS